MARARCPVEGGRFICLMWNLVATGTREGDVYHLLLTKLEAERAALGTGQVFDVLGKAFSGQSLRGLLIEAVRYGDRPEVQARMEQVIDATVSEGIPELLRQEALASEVISEAEV